MRLYYSILDRIDLWACDKPIGLIIVLLSFAIFIALGIATAPNHEGWEQVGNLRVHLSK